MERKRFEMSVDTRNITCFFTGHRTLDTKIIQPLLRNEVERAYIAGYRYFGAGGAIGFDMIAAEEVLYAKQKHTDIRLILVLPYPDYRNKWQPDDIERMDNIMRKADKIVYVRDFYTRDAYYARNRRMADYSSRCICYKTKDTGGTAYTLSYVERELVKKQGYAYDIFNLVKNNS